MRMDISIRSNTIVAWSNVKESWNAKSIAKRDWERDTLHSLILFNVKVSIIVSGLLFKMESTIIGRQSIF